MREAQSVEFSDTGPHFSDVQFSPTQRSAVERSVLDRFPVVGGGRGRPVPRAYEGVLRVVQWYPEGEAAVLRGSRSRESRSSSPGGTPSGNL